MHLIRAATLTVSDLKRSQSYYCDWLDYSCIETGNITTQLAESWGTPNTAGRPYIILQPRSGADVFLRFIEQPEVKTYKALRSYGWNAIEICTQDTEKVNVRMQDSPFEIIGPPQKIPGLDSIYPMQVKGPDEEIVFLTQINGDMPTSDLPRAESPIDKLFILVMGCSDMTASKAWLKQQLLISAGKDMAINYTMINKAFGLQDGTQHKLSTLKHERDVFLEIDQYPDGTIHRQSHDDMLPPCIAIGSFIHPDFEKLIEINKDRWITPPEIRQGALYKGRRAATLQTPDGTLIEMIES